MDGLGHKRSCAESPRKPGSGSLAKRSPLSRAVCTARPIPDRRIVHVPKLLLEATQSDRTTNLLKEKDALYPSAGAVGKNPVTASDDEAEAVWQVRFANPVCRTGVESLFHDCI